MRVVFMGTPHFAVPVLDALDDAGHRIVCVYTQPPRPAGRGKRLRRSAVHARAEALGLPVRHPASLKPTDEQASFAALGADVGIVVAYGLLLPQSILDAPSKGCVNVHASLLPRWRGAAPIHRAIMAGDAETGACLMAMELGLDTGPVLLRHAIPIAAEDTVGKLHDRLSALGADLALEGLRRLDELVPVPQPEDGVTYAAKIDKAETRIDWSRPAIEVDRTIRGLSPSPSAWCDISGERVRLLRSRLIKGEALPGTVLRDFDIACGTGAVRILEAQRAGRGALSAKDVLRGLTLPARLP